MTQQNQIEVKRFDSREDYDAFTALNYSGSKSLLISPQHYLWAMGNKKDSPAMKLGRAIHGKILEPEVYSSTFAIVPKVDKRTKEGKETWAKLEAELVGKELLSDQEAEVVNLTCTKVLQIMEKNEIQFEETEVRYAVPYQGIWLKASFDAVGSDGYIYDIKTTDDASQDGFLRSVRTFKYNLQAFFYQVVFFMVHGINAKGFRFIVVEKESPGVAIYELGDLAMEFAQMDFVQAVEQYKEANETGKWKNFDDKPMVVDFKG